MTIKLELVFISGPADGLVVASGEIEVVAATEGLSPNANDAGALVAFVVKDLVAAAGHWVRLGLPRVGLR
jgi:hypothetical protein